MGMGSTSRKLLPLCCSPMPANTSMLGNDSVNYVFVYVRLTVLSNNAFVKNNHIYHFVLIGKFFN